MPSLLAGARFFSIILLTLFCALLHRLAAARGARRQVAHFWFCAMNFFTGLRPQVSGHIHRGNGVLYAANHVSYLDILAIGGLLDAVFVAKQEIAGWPLIGRAGSMGECVFVSRKPADVHREAMMIRRRLEEGRNVILFPEGTTGCGTDLLPFKSALLAALDGIPQARVQPVSITYPDLERGGVDTSLAWFGDMALLPHLWLVLKRGFSPARLRFHPVLNAADFSDRKLLAAACQARIASGMSLNLDEAAEENALQPETLMAPQPALPAG
jgi:lyso-ornithine lipid O-acyltransferase